MSKENKVEVQKGKIVGNPPTMNHKGHSEKVREALEDNAARWSYQSTHLHEPKR